MRGNGTIKRGNSFNKNEKNIVHERAKIWKRILNMVVKIIKRYQKLLHVKGEININPHVDFTIYHKTGFTLLKVSLVPVGKLPTSFSVFCQSKGTKYSKNLKKKSLEEVFEKLLQA